MSDKPKLSWKDFIDAAVSSQREVPSADWKPYHELQQELGFSKNYTKKMLQRLVARGVLERKVFVTKGADGKFHSMAHFRMKEFTDAHENPAPKTKSSSSTRKGGPGKQAAAPGKRAPKKRH